MNKIFTENGWKDYIYWQTEDKKTLKKINSLIEDICRKTAYSKAYLFRIFKAKTGKTIMRCFVEMKIKEAKQLLRENELSVREISERLAFSTPDYFTKTFKKVTGLTPLAYKKRTSVL